MFLEKLEIFGFKAIPYKLRVKYGPGVTGIIGPNGCGKSNLSDAIRWVLGEQSVRQLRGHSMEDVIFNGTANRKPLGMAEVSLTFSNANGIVPIDYETVTVGRRLYRSGQSEYLINKAPCRLRDVRDLLLDTGIGSSGYSLIAREMVESVLADDSGQRRQMLEEAAGISKYKARKREALLKLKATETDLVRVADIVTEVGREVRSLGRQVGKARRYRRYLERIRLLDLALSRLRVHDLAARRDELETSLVSRHADLETRRARVGELELSLETRRLGDVEIERELSEAQALLERLDRRLAEWDSEAKVLRERRSATEQRMREAGEEIKRLTVRQLTNAEQREQSATDLVSLEAADTEEGAVLRQREATFRAVDGEWRRLREQLGERKQLRFDLVEDHVERRAAYAQASTRRTELETRLTSLVGERQGAGQEYDERAARLSGANLELEELRSQAGTTQAELQSIEGRVAERETQTQTLGEESAAFAERAVAHESRLEVLFDLKRRYEGYARGVQTLLAEGRPDGLHGTVSELLRVPADLIDAMEAALGPAMGHIVAEARGQVGEQIDRLRSAQGGRASFLPLDNLQVGGNGDDGGSGGNGGSGGSGGSGGNGATPPPSGPGILGLANQLVAPHQEQFRPMLDYLLADVLVVEGREQALAVIAGADAAGYRIVTRDGELWTGSGVVAGGATGSTTAASPLGREQEIAAVESALAGVREQLRELADRRESLTQELEDAQQTRDRLRHRSEQEREAIFELEKAVQAAELAMHAQAEAVAELDDTRRDLGAEIEQLAAEAASLSDALDSARTRSDDFETTHAELEVEIARLEGEREQRLREEQESRLRWTENTGRLTQVRARTDRLAQELGDIEAELARRRTEIADGHAQVDELSGSIATLEEQVRDGLLEREEKEGRLRAVETQYAEARAATVEIEKQAREVRRGLDQLVEDVHEREIELERARGEIEATSARIREEHELELLETNESLDEGQSVDEATEELTQLRDRMRTLGPVNLLAIEQYDEIKERFRFLSTQRDDLTRAREELLEAIERINTTASEIFAHTFADVQANFLDVFQTLFEGGEAQLRLVGDPLDGMIEIMARPRGKNLRSVSLMSGGERALTAISLLFAIYLAKPSPFCIMDEVDAPLDDANIGRFVNLLRRFSRDTQFIVITHNKSTMEAAERLYGVTMEEPGVSKLVSVHFEQGELRETMHAEPATEQATEQATEPAIEQATEPAIEQATEPAIEQATEPATEQAAEPVTEQADEPSMPTPAEAILPAAPLVPEAPAGESLPAPGSMESVRLDAASIEAELDAEALRAAAGPIEARTSLGEPDAEHDGKHDGKQTGPDTSRTEGEALVSATPSSGDSES